MYKIIILSVLVSSFANAYSTSTGQSKIEKNKVVVREMKADDMSVEFQLGSQRTLNGPDDSSGLKTSMTFSKNLGNFIISPQISYVFYNENGEGDTNVTTTVFEAELWGRYRFWHNARFHTYGGLGLGARRDYIKTNVMSFSSSTESEYYSLISTAIGGAWTPSPYNKKNFLAGLRLTLEMQLHMIPSYDYQDVGILLGTGYWF